MSKIDSLISQFCPDMVKWSSIQEICLSITSGGTPNTTNNSYYNGSIPWLRTQEVNWKDVTETSIKISEEGLKNSSAKLIPENCVIVALYGATAAKVAINKIPLSTNQACCNLQINPEIALYRYVFYWLTNQYNVLKALGEGSQSNINGLKVKKFPIPIPPLPIQQEIVNILDKFTQLEAELEAELKARKVQYEYYRNEIVENKNVLSIRRLGDFIYFPKTRINAKLLNKENYVGVENLVVDKQGKVISNYVPNRGEWVEYKRDDVLIGNIRPYLKKIWLAKHEGGTNGDVVVIRIRDDKKEFLIPRFLYFLLSSDAFFNYYNNFSKGGKMPRGDKKSILEYFIPMYSIQEQNKYSIMLEKFEMLVNNLSSGIPAEINARKKQYEYYRNKLLTFKPE